MEDPFHATTNPTMEETNNTLLQDNKSDAEVKDEEEEVAFMASNLRKQACKDKFLLARKMVGCS